MDLERSEITSARFKFSAYWFDYSGEMTEGSEEIRNPPEAPDQASDEIKQHLSPWRNKLREILNKIQKESEVPGTVQPTSHKNEERGADT
jgi:hypothetical protein